MSVYNLLKQNWKTITDSYQIQNGDCLLINSLGSDSIGSLTLTLPNNPKKGDYFSIKDIMFSFDKFPITLNSNNIPLYLDSSSNPVLSCLIKTKGMENEIIYDGSSWKFSTPLIKESGKQNIWQSIFNTIVKKSNGTYWWFGDSIETTIDEELIIEEGISSISCSQYGFCVKTLSENWFYFGFKETKSGFVYISPSSPLDVSNYANSYSAIMDDELICNFVYNDIIDNSQSAILSSCQKVFNPLFCLDKSNNLNEIWDVSWPVSSNMTLSYYSTPATGINESDYCLGFDSENNLYQSKFEYAVESDILTFVKMNDLKVDSYSKLELVFKLTNGDIIGFPYSSEDNYMVMGWTKIEDYYGLPYIYKIPDANIVTFSANNYVFGGIDSDGYVWQCGYSYCMKPYITTSSEIITLTKSTFNINS